MGGVLYSYANEEVEIDDCVFENNYSNYVGGTLWLYYTSRPSVIKNSVFIESKAASTGGAIHVEKVFGITVENVIFKDCDSVGSWGGALYFI